MFQTSEIEFMIKFQNLINWVIIYQFLLI